LKRSTG